jgi:hypothetical protein
LPSALPSLWRRGQFCLWEWDESIRIQVHVGCESHVDADPGW